MLSTARWLASASWRRSIGVSQLRGHSRTSEELARGSAAPDDDIGRRPIEEKPRLGHFGKDAAVAVERRRNGGVRARGEHQHNREQTTEPRQRD